MRLSDERARNERLTVAFMGLDGTGKSTQSQRLHETILARGGRSVQIHHASTRVPGIRALKLRYHGVAIRLLKRRGVHVDWEDRERGNAGGATTIGSLIGAYFLLGSFVKSVWYAWRYRTRLVILDRCFLDDIVKVRWRLGQNLRLGSLLMRLAPRPDLVVVFEGDPLETYARKKSENCTYREYLEKGKVLDLTLKHAVEYGWNILRIPIDGREPEDIQGTVLEILKKQQDSQTRTARHEPGSEHTVTQG